MRNSNSILNGFRNSNTSNISEISKGILNPAKVDSSKYDIFSGSQINQYLQSVIAKNEGMAVEIQKSVVASVKQEMSCLIPVNIMHNGSVKKFYVSKTGACGELCKAVEPVNKQEGYFDNKIDEDEVISFIADNDEVDDEILTKKFGKGIEDVLNDLQEEGKIDVDDDGYYFASENNGDEDDNGGDNSDEDEEGNENDQVDEGDEGDNNDDESDQNQDGDNDDEDDQNNENGYGTDGTQGGDIQNLDGDDEGDQNDEGDNNGDQNNEGEGDEEGNGDNNGDNEDNDNLGDEGDQNDGDSDFNEEDDQDNNESEGEGNENLDEDNKGNQGEGDNMGASNESSPEELEAMAKKTATVSLLKFYKNSSDDKLKEIAAIELKSRGVNPETGEGGVNGGNGEGGDKNLPDNKAALDELEKWTKSYLGSYDKEDLVQYVVDLANQSPAKRKELKDLYREHYSAANAGNKALKVDENDFKEFLTEHYFNNFTPGDLQSYAYLLISKNPKEYRKFKKMLDSENEPII